MSQNELTMVYPGGDTRCMSAESPRYAFMVVPRDKDKLLFHFEGGGACWDQLSTAAKSCYVIESRARNLHGYFDHKKADNPLKHHTLVYISACSGDLHAGRVQHGYRDEQGNFVEQRGYNNVRATVDWVQRNFGEAPFSSLVITGESAGSIGVQVWAHNLLSQLRYEKASVISDSYLSVFPTGFTGGIFKSLEVCHTGLLDFSADIMRKCDSGVLTPPEVFEAAIADFPKVDFGSISSKHDPVQMHYYMLTGLSMGKPQQLTPDAFRMLVPGVLSRYQKYPNHGHFLFSSPWHVYGCVSFHDYGKTTEMAFSDGANGKMRQKFEEWLGHIVASDHSAGSYCERLSPRKLKEQEIGATVDACPKELESVILNVQSDGEA